MVTVMCSSALYRALGERRAPEGKASPERPVRLGDWAAILATSTSLPCRDLVRDLDRKLIESRAIEAGSRSRAGPC